MTPFVFLTPCGVVPAKAFFFGISFASVFFVGSELY
jgi:hypothetical protein